MGQHHTDEANAAASGFGEQVLSLPPPIQTHEREPSGAQAQRHRPAMVAGLGPAPNPPGSILLKVLQFDFWVRCLKQMFHSELAG